MTNGKSNLIAVFTNSPWTSPLTQIRLLEPLRCAGFEVLRGRPGEMPSREQIAGAQAIIMQRDFPASKREYAIVRQAADEYSIPLIMEIDDLLLALPEEHPDRRTGFYAPMLLSVWRALVEADAVFASTTRLAEYLWGAGINAITLANRLPDALWREAFALQNYGAHRDVILGYAGGKSHSPDVELVLPVLARLLERYQELVVHFFGMPKPVVFRDHPRVRWTETDSNHYERFIQSIISTPLDLCIAPLQKSLFNQCKSSIKFLEYSAMGIPGVYNAGDPYERIVSPAVNGFLAAEEPDWEYALSQMIDSAELRQKLGLEARRTVLEDHLLSSHGEEWEAAIHTAIEKGRRKNPICEGALQPLANIEEQIMEYHLGLLGALRAEEGRIWFIPQLISELREEKDDLLRQREDLNLEVKDLQREKEQISSSLKGMESAWRVSHAREVELSTRWAELEESTAGRLVVTSRAMLAKYFPLGSSRYRVLRAGLSGLRILRTRGVVAMLKAGGSKLAALLRILALRNQHSHPRIELPPGETTPLSKDDKIRVVATTPPEELVFATSEKPLVSVILPIHNQWEYTWRCLESISENPPLATFEILVLDDTSTDKSADKLKRIRGIRVIRNPENLGFLRTCNKAAQEAKGDYLYFLNNDTIVASGWLDGLLEQFQTDPLVGLVGSKLVYPSGHLQEAGAYVGSEGWSVMVGLNDNPDRGWYNVSRQVDYVSGASMMVDRALYLALGGLDEAYFPAYYEDTDLCFRVRRAGRKVVYAPGSRITHHLSVSAEDHDRKMELVERNRATFRERWGEELASANRMRIIAFYLPQFHPIPENDVWWGRGFTEWVNVSKAIPNFEGHYQPHLPGALGYYDLRLPDVREAQAALAREFGIGGFCYYYYWFNGKRLLERPLEEMRASKHPDFPYCVCWANENWTRRWDGRESDILIAQQYSTANDELFLKDLYPHFCDHRYIRVHDKPILLIYKLAHLPHPAETIEFWRKIARRDGMGELYIAAVDSFMGIPQGATPNSLGIDAVVEFPPNGSEQTLRLPGEKLTNPSFRGTLYDYPAAIEKYCRKHLPDYPYYRTAMPGWDNTARRQDDSHIFVGSTPELFSKWMETILRQTRAVRPPEERIMFVNAWNEWAEGNHLEPDHRHQDAYLRAIRTAMKSCGLIPWNG